MISPDHSTILKPLAMMIDFVHHIMIVKTVQAMTPKDQAALTVGERAEYTRSVRLHELSGRDFKSLTTAEQTELGTLQLERPRQQFSPIQPSWLIWSIIIVVCLYAVTGGLEAAFLSDMIQGLFILLLSVILIPFSVAMINQRYGGDGIMDAFRTLHQVKSESFFQIFG